MRERGDMVGGERDKEHEHISLGLRLSRSQVTRNQGAVQHFDSIGPVR